MVARAQRQQGVLSPMTNQSGTSSFFLSVAKRATDKFFTHWQTQFIFDVMASFRKNLDQLCGDGILRLMLVMLVFAPLAFGAVYFYPWTFLVLEGLGAVLFILWSLRLWLDPKPKLLWPPLAWVVVAFTAYAVIRYFTADIEYVARVEVIQVLLFALVFFVIVNNLYSQDTAQAISFTLITLGTLIAGYAIYQSVTHSHYVWNVLLWRFEGRACGTYLSPNNLAGLLAMLIPLGLAYLLAGRIHILTRIGLVYAVAAMVAGLGVTFSRGGWIAAGGGVLFVLSVLLCHRNHRLRALILLLALLVGGGFFISQYLSKTTTFAERVVRPGDSGPSVVDADTRLGIWQAAINIWQDHFWVGAGPAHFDYRFDVYRPEFMQTQPIRAHNDYLNLLADWGTIGGVIVLIGIVIFIWALFRTWPHVRRAEDDFGSGQSNRFAFFIGATGALLALSIHSVVDFDLHIPANALVGVTLLALLASNLRFATAGCWWRINTLGKIALTSVVLATVISFAADEWRRGHETLWRAQAERQLDNTPAKAVRLEKAFIYEPHNFRTAYEIGECYRTESFKGGSDFASLAQTAMDWYDRGNKLDPFDAYIWLRMGMCLDWIGKPGQAEKYYNQAEALNPNAYIVLEYIGWHYVQIHDYAAARQYLIRSVRINSHSDFSRNYLGICEAKLAEKASGRPTLPFDY
ncbi:MAG TPA: O-antigen ligase family protein [Verrucomicrobiae bacterium]|jgi:O-antigen ligase